MIASHHQITQNHPQQTATVHKNTTQHHKTQHNTTYLVEYLDESDLPDMLEARLKVLCCVAALYSLAVSSIWRWLAESKDL